jgi:23S rRNA (cytidine2498-2'-O)-methyltransferase
VADMRRSGFNNIKWIMSDVSATPNYTLDSVEDIVTRDDVNIRGMLLTLKLTKWELVKELPQYLDRIRSWGYKYIRTRQLAFNRREICVAVMKSRAIRRIKRRRKK